MPWREGLVVSIGLLVGGCFLPAYQIASWTATGVSYMLSGKGVGDHALSLAMNQDCATWRLLQGAQICVDYGSDFESSWAAMASTWNLPQQSPNTDVDLAAGGPDDPVPDAVVALATAQVPDRHETKRPPVRTILARSPEPVEKRPVRGIDFDGLVVPEWAVAPPRETAWQPNGFASRGLDLDGLVRVERQKDFTAIAPMAAVTNKGTDPAIFVVMGSFRDKKNAERLGAKHAHIKTAVSKVANDGRTMYRLLAGPVEKTALTGLRVDLAKSGIRNSWAVKLCRGNFTAPPCQAPVQEAKLP